MSAAVAHSIAQTAAAYGAVGAAVAAAFLLWGLDRVDPSAAGRYAFRPLLLPGLVLLWPLVLLRWAALERGAPAPRPRGLQTVHRRIWAALAVLAPGILAGALLLRSADPHEAPPVRLPAAGAPR